MASSASLSMPSSLSLQPPRCSSHRHQVGISFSLLKNSEDVVVSGMWRPRLLRSAYLIDCKKRRTLICAVNQDAEEAFKKTVEVDRLIDKLRDANPIELQKLVVENVLAFNEGFWIRLAARTDTCKSEDDKKDYEELAISVMSIVDRLVHKTNEKINSATDVLKGILKPVVDDVVEIQWPPRDPESLKLMEKEITEKEKEGLLDEGFLSEVNAQLRQAKEDGDKPGLEAMLQKVLQLYASKVLSKRSYAKKGDEILKAEEFLETIIKAPEEEWNKLLLNGLSIGKGDIPPPDLYAVIKKRIERTLIRTEGGSYQQRVLSEYLNGIQSRAEQVVQVLEGKPQ
ncbi:uncharacterized protein LOC126785021 isoform X2 [Argentina anserina]|uniref:uncharacterized protein LOC126785021 isoform X2 n=1 Tax=Argentina anserina TaxID=57926 RepID=UPI00217694B1|nr:uncharacterized protein LOC126785021 isoform X2 [Potentilla anserina]